MPEIDEKLNSRDAMVFLFGERSRVNRHSATGALALGGDETGARDQCDLRFAFRLFTGDQSSPHSFQPLKRGWTTIVWGTLFHAEDGSIESALTSIENFLLTDDHKHLQKLSGLFLCISYNEGSGQISVVNDCMGARPFFYCDRSSIFIGGTQAFLVADQCGIKKAVYLPAVSQYLLFGYNASRGSLIDGVMRPPPASITSWAKERLRTRVYLPQFSEQESLGPYAMGEHIHKQVRRSFCHWTAAHKEVVVGLSGGFDSRYLSALTEASTIARRRYINIESDPRETTNARVAASVLGIDLEIVHCPRSVWDAYEPEPLFHLRPDGFPVTKSVNRLVVRRATGYAMIDGYLGDPLVRGTFDSFGEFSDLGDETERFERILERMANSELSRLAPKYYVILKKLAFSEAIATKEQFGFEGPDVTYIDLFLRQRCYIDNNFVQNLHEQEPILPFLSLDLILNKATHPQGDFCRATYEGVFARINPELASIGHNKDLAAKVNRQSSATHRSWALEALREILSGNLGQIFNAKFVLPRAVLALRNSQYLYAV